MFKLLKNSAGTTLVEVIAGVLIVTAVALAVLAAVSQSSVFGVRADKIYSASLVAQERIEEIRNYSFHEIESLAPENDTAIDHDADGEADHLRTTEIQTDYDGYAGLIRVKVTVRRVSEGAATGGPVVMETLVADFSTVS